MEDDDNYICEEFGDYFSAGSKYKAMKKSLKIDFDTVRKEIEADELKKSIETETRKEREKSELEEKEMSSSENGKSTEEIAERENRPTRCRRTRACRKRNADPLDEETQEKQRHLSSSPIYIADSPVHSPNTAKKPSDLNNFIYISSDDEEPDHCLDISVPEEDDNYEISVKVWWRFVRFDKFNIRRFQKLTCLFEHYSELESVDQKQILLTLNDVMIHPNDTPDSLNLTIADIIEGGITSSKDSNRSNAVSKKQVPSLTEDELELKVQRKGCKEPLIIRFLKTQKMKIFMLKCAESLELPVEKLKFSFDGDSINSSDTPVDLDLEGGECIDLHILE